MFASDLLALALGAIGASTFVGYAADLEVAPRLVEGLGLAPSAGLAWTLGAAAVLLAHPGRGLGAILVALGPGGGVARRLLPVVAAVPIAMAASRLMLDWAGLGRTAFGTAAEMVTLLGLGFLMVLWASYPLQWSEQALHDSEARLRGLVEAMPDALFFLDVSDRITEANPAAARLFGQPRKAFVGQPLTRWIQPEPVDRTPGLFDALAEAECPYVPGLALRLGEPPSPVEVTRTHLSTVTGEPDALICRDVSERERTAEALASRTSELMQARALERLKDHVYSSLSHELKTPLTVIRGNTEMLQEDWPDDVRIQSLQDAVQRLNDHIEALLDHAALLAGDMPLYMGPVAAQEVLTALAERYRTSAAAHGLTLHVACEAGLPPVTADGHRLSQALAALLDNAVKFASAGGHIGARARQDGNDVVLEVWNSGPGIPAAVLARLGETFYQAEIGNTRRHGGLGLGLAIARMLVALHGGTLTGSSCAGKGTTFAIRLPTEELAAASATPTTQRP
jgi:PAS domain S-box-containing protein